MHIYIYIYIYIYRGYISRTQVRRVGEEGDDAARRPEVRGAEGRADCDGFRRRYRDYGITRLLPFKPFVTHVITYLLFSYDETWVQKAGRLPKLPAKTIPTKLRWLMLSRMIPYGNENSTP